MAKIALWEETRDSQESRRTLRDRSMTVRDSEDCRREPGGRVRGVAPNLYLKEAYHAGGNKCCTNIILLHCMLFPYNQGGCNFTMRES